MTIKGPLKLVASKAYGFALTITLALSGAEAYAADTDERPQHHPMRFDHLSLDDGLSQSNVFTILQDSDGLMWFGTENGLNSYNGYDFEHYKQERGNPEALGSDYIYDIEEDQDGNLWIATNGGGVAKMSKSTRRFETFRHDPTNSNSLSSNVVRSIQIDGDMVWLASRGQGLDQLNTKTQRFTHYSFGDGEHPNQNPDEIYALHKGSAGAIWIGSNAGLTKLEPESGEFSSYAHDPANDFSLSDNRVRAIFEDSSGRLWIGTYGGGINLFDDSTGTFSTLR